MAKKWEVSYLLDFYGDVLTEKERQLLKEFNDMKWLLYGPQDYAVIGVKEKER